MGSREQPAHEHRFVREVVTYVVWVSSLELVTPRMEKVTPHFVDAHGNLVYHPLPRLSCRREQTSRARANAGARSTLAVVQDSICAVVSPPRAIHTGEKRTSDWK